MNLVLLLIVGSNNGSILGQKLKRDRENSSHPDDDLRRRSGEAKNRRRAVEPPFPLCAYHNDESTAVLCIYGIAAGGQQVGPGRGISFAIILVLEIY